MKQRHGACLREFVSLHPETGRYRQTLDDACVSLAGRLPGPACNILTGYGSNRLERVSQAFPRLCANVDRTLFCVKDDLALDHVGRTYTSCSGIFHNPVPSLLNTFIDTGLIFANRY